MRSCKAGAHVAAAILLLSAWEASGRQVVISEVMSSNVSTLYDEDGDTPDWLELYNAGTEAVDLAGYGLTDDPLVPFRWEMPSQPLGPGEFAVVMASGKDRAAVPAAWETVIRRGTLWRYLVGSPAATWKDRFYNDGSWPTGPSGFGYGDGDDATIVPFGTITVYARTTFQVDDVSKVVGARLHVDYDDAFVAYINGTEVARANIGAPGEPTSPGQTADRDREATMYTGSRPDGWIVPDPGSLLLPGTNVLAVEVHNVGSGSSDLSLIPFLTLATASAVSSVDGVDPELEGLFAMLASHTNFSLSEGEFACLASPGGLDSDCVEIVPGPSDISFGIDESTGSVGFFEIPTPGWANAGFVYSGQAPAAVMSHEAGFHSSSFSMTLTSPDPTGRIAYTTDGSVPSGVGAPAPVTVPVSETAVVRARILVPGKLPGPVVTRTYLFEPTRTLPVVSISTTPANLWDHYTGIYVEGPNVGQCGQPYTCYNYWQEWEIPVHMEWFEPGGSLGYGVDAGMQIYGAWSRMRPQKSVALYARPEYGANAFEYPFFADRPFDSYQNLVFRNSGNDFGLSLLRDGYMETLVQGTEVDYMAYRAAVHFLNGEYWGILNAREKINEHYAANVGDVDPDSIDLIDYSGGPHAIHGDMAHYQALSTYLASQDMTSPEELAHVATLMDLDNFIDYNIAQIYYDNRDWPGNNSKVWRPRRPGGRLRWIMFDTDFGLGLDYSSPEPQYNQNTLAFALEPNGPGWPNPPWSTLFLRRLVRNGDFRTLFVNRFADFLNTRFSVGRMEAVLDSLASAIESEIPVHVARWGGMSWNSWVNEIAEMRTFAQQRAPYMIQHVQAVFAVAGRSHISVAVAEPGGGTIRVNREHVGRGPWSGLYFVGIPVPVTAIPAEGYRFAGWTGTVASSSAAIEVDPSGGVSLFAHFVPDAVVDSPVVINEIQYHPADGFPSEDWIEMVNISLEEVDLSGWTLSDGDPLNVFTLPAGTTLAPGGYTVLCQDPLGFAAAYTSVPCTGGWPFGFSAAGETVYLRDAAGALVDTVAYGDTDPWPAQADGGGATLELVDAAMDNALPSAWQASFVPGGTPGARNSTAVANEPPPEVPSGSPRIAAFPNPFSGRASLVVEGPPEGDATVEVYDAIGRRLGRLEIGRLEPGPNVIPWMEASGAAGLRFVRLIVDGRPVASAKIVRID